jgi:hypothetical protein
MEPKQRPRPTDLHRVLDVLEKERVVLSRSRDRTEQIYETAKELFDCADEVLESIEFAIDRISELV